MRRHIRARRPRSAGPRDGAMLVEPDGNAVADLDLGGALDGFDAVLEAGLPLGPHGTTGRGVAVGRTRPGFDDGGFDLLQRTRLLLDAVDTASEVVAAQVHDHRNGEDDNNQPEHHSKCFDSILASDQGLRLSARKTQA